MNLVRKLIASAWLAGAMMAASVSSHADLTWRPQLVNIGDVDIYTETAGSGDTAFVLMSGLASPLSTWDKLAPDLATLGTVLRYQRAGYSPSSESNAGLGRDDHDRHLEHILNEVLPGRKVILVAHSMGTLIARAFANQHSQLVSGVILIDPTPERLMYGVGIADEMIDAMIEQNVKGAERMGIAAMHEMRLQYAMEDSAGEFPLTDIPTVVISSFQLPPANLAEQWGVSQSVVDQTYLQKLAIQQAIIKDNALGLGIVTSKSGHFVHESEPGLVIDGANWLLAIND